MKKSTISLVSRTLSLVGLSLALLAATAARASAPPTNESDERRTPVVRAVQKATPAVVNISTKQVRVVQPLIWMEVPEVFRQQLPDAFKPRRQVVGSLGSGVIISSKGYIVTNAHVVNQADEIIVTLADESQHKAELVSADPEADLAIIKMETDKPMPAIRLGISSDLMIGETVIAVGNPFGYQHTVTTGVVSALDRSIQAAPGSKYENLIQTDAPINPGNSGGPLLNIRGELIGINTAIRAGAQGLGFAIPVDKVREIMIELLAVRPAGGAWLGLKFNRTQPAAVVDEVEKDSPAAKAGLAKSDRIESLDGRALPDVLEMEATLLDRKVDDTIKLGVRRGSETLEFKFALAEKPKPDGVRLAKAEFGLHVQTLKPDMATAMKLAIDRGLLVASVDKDSPASAAGFEINDIVVQVDRYRITDTDTLGALLTQVKKDDKILFYVVRGRTVARAIMAARDPTTE
jgi:serine protease Do